MSWYARHILAPCIDKAMQMPEVMQKRAQLVPGAEGRVLEIGVGSGLNLRFYEPGQVTEVIGLDPFVDLAQRAVQRAADARVPFRLLHDSAEAISLGDGSVDSAVMTYTLCSITDRPRALAELRRVLRP